MQIALIFSDLGGRQNRPYNMHNEHNRHRSMVGAPCHPLWGRGNKPWEMRQACVGTGGCVDVDAGALCLSWWGLALSPKAYLQKMKHTLIPILTDVI
jgi:hypothetical protein